MALPGKDMLAVPVCPLGPGYPDEAYEQLGAG